MKTIILNSPKYYNLTRYIIFDPTKHNPYNICLTHAVDNTLLTFCSLVIQLSKMMYYYEQYCGRES